MNQFKNILIVRTDRTGDVVLTTPVISALREHYPHARLSMMVTPETRDIVEGNPHLDSVIIFDRKKIGKNVLEFILNLRKKKFDLAIILHTKKITNLICFLAGIPRRIGYRNEKFGFLLTERIKDTRAEGIKHEVEYSLDVLRHLGISVNNPKVFLPIQEDAERWVEKFFKEHHLTASDRLIAVHPDASCISKRWPPRNFAELINKIQKKHSVKILLIGTEASRGIICEIISLVRSYPETSGSLSFPNAFPSYQGLPLVVVGNPDEAILRPPTETFGGDSFEISSKQTIIDLSGKTTVSQLISLFKRCEMLISNDSGPVHIAGGVGIPVISIFGRNQAGLSPVRWRPLSEKSVVFHRDVGCKICLAHNCDINFKCLEAVHPQEVFEAFDALLSLC